MALSAEQTHNAQIIIQVGQSMGIPSQGLVVALATAMQESSLRNLNYGDRDSLGLFQQRPSQGWGTAAQVTDPQYAARKFYQTLLSVPNWQSMAPTYAAQAVQRSAFPEAYAQWVGMAQGLVGQYAGGNAAAQQQSNNVSVARQTDNSGISIENSSVGQYLPTAQPVLSLDTLRSESPLVAAIVQAVPELTSIFQNAVSGSWSTDKFISAVQNSSWWATHSDTARQAFATMKGDPATWNQTVTNLETKLQHTAASLGAVMSISSLQNLAVDALTNGYDTNDAQLRAKFMQYVNPVSGNHFGGEAGSAEEQLRTAMRELGVFMPEGNLDTQLCQIVGGQQTVQGVNAQLRTQAQSMYPAYSQQINSGMNVSDIAAPYISRASQLLEQGPGQMNISNPAIKKALQYSVNGKPTAMPMGDFENTIRKDPKWVSTDNAQDAMMTNAHRVLQNFGLAF